MAGGQFGLAISNLSPGQLSSYGTSFGVFVEDTSGAADRAGVRRGDVIEQVNDQDAMSVEIVNAILATVDRTRNIRLLVRRNNLSHYILLKP